MNRLGGFQRLTAIGGLDGTETDGGTPAGYLAEMRHEALDFSEYSAGPVTDGGNLAVTAAAALNGSAGGLSVTIPNTLTVKYAYRLLAAAITTGIVRYRFYINPNGIVRTPDTGNTVVIVANASSQPCSFASLYGMLAGGPGVYAVAVDDANGDHNTGIVPITDGPHRVEVLTVRASSAIAADGYTELYVDGAFHYRTEFCNNFTRMSAYQLLIAGAPSGIDAGTNGTYYLDDLAFSDKALEIGP